MDVGRKMLKTQLVNALEKAEWNYGSKTVSLYLDYDYDKLSYL
jgi:hypothetical protein